MDLLKTPIRLMEKAIIERLRIAFPERDFQIDRVPHVLTIKEFERVVRLTPFIGLAWMGCQPDRNNGRAIKAAGKWRLIMIVKASSSLQARFKGDARDIGLDAMIDVATALLQGTTFDEIGASAVTAAEPVYADGWADEAIAVAQVDFEISYLFSPAGLGLKTIDEFRALGITWLNDESPDEGGVKPEEDHLLPEIA